MDMAEIGSIYLLIMMVCCCLTILAYRVSLPALFLAVLAFCHALYFCITGVFGTVPNEISHWWHFSQDVRPHAITVMLVFTGQALIATICGISAAIFARHSSVSVDPNLSTLRFPKLDSLFTTLSVFLLIGLAVGHATFVDWKALWSYSTYLYVRDPDSVGLHFLPLAIFHRVAGQLGLVALISVRLVRTRNPIARWMFIALSLYCFVMTIAFCSRLSAAYVALFAFLWRRADWPEMLQQAIRGFVVLLALAVYANIIAVRTNGEFAGGERLGHYGIYPAIISFSQLQFLSRETLAIFAASLFGSGYQLHAAIRSAGGFEYPLAFKIASFSPLPSSIDGYRDMADLHLIKPLETGPYSSFSEVILFGPIWTVAFIVILASTTFFVSMAYGRQRGMLGTAAFALFAVGTIYLQTYPIRNSIRALYLAILLSIISIYLKRLILRTQRQKYA